MQGSVVDRHASEKEKLKDLPTYKDKDFLGDRKVLFVGSEARQKLLSVFQADAEVVTDIVYIWKLELFCFELCSAICCCCCTMHTLKGMSDERQSSDFIGRQNCPTDFCCVSCKNRPILLADKIGWFCRPIYNMFYLRRFCLLTFCRSVNKFCLCCHGDCLQPRPQKSVDFVVRLTLA